MSLLFKKDYFVTVGCLRVCAAGFTVLGPFGSRFRVTSVSVFQPERQTVHFRDSPMSFIGSKALVTCIPISIQDSQNTRLSSSTKP